MKPTLYLMVGYPGAGKTTVSQMLHKLTGAEHLWADHVRKERFGQPTYTRSENSELYDRLDQETARLLGEGKSVVYDTNFKFQDDRQKLRDIATKAGAKTVLIWVQTPAQIAKERATTLGNVIGRMTEADFDRLIDKLEEPQPDENPIIIDGTKVDEAYLQAHVLDR